MYGRLGLHLEFVGYPQEVFRAVDPKYADQAKIDPAKYVTQTLGFNQAAGGRYNAPGECGVLYTASEEETAWAELHARMLREGLPGLPPTMGLIYLNILKGEHVDLNDGDTRNAWGISLASIQADTPTLRQQEDCWEFGRAVRVVADFVRAPSARAPGDNIPLFIGFRSTGDFDYAISGADPSRSTPQRFHATAQEEWD
jgi:RES domain-containing protein